jgi:hypothetical protein
MIARKFGRYLHELETDDFQSFFLDAGYDFPRNPALKHTGLQHGKCSFNRH